MNTEKVIEGLENLKETIKTATQHTFTSGNVCAMNMAKINNAIALLKEQDNTIDTLHTVILGYETGIIQCKDCKFQIDRGRRYPECDKHFLWAKDDWFCADGKHK